MWNHANHNNLYAPSQIYNYKKNLKKREHFLPHSKIRTALTFGHRKISSNHYHDTHFFTIFISF